jgi:hypothetical protein
MVSSKAQTAQVGLLLNHGQKRSFLPHNFTPPSGVKFSAPFYIPIWQLL